MADYAPKLLKVVIVKRGDRAIVWPPYLVASAGDYVTFSSFGLTTRIEFPLDLAFEPNKSNHSPTTEEPSWSGVENVQGGMEAIVRLEPGASCRVKLADGTAATQELRAAEGVLKGRAADMLSGNTQVYTYSVFCLEINDFAEGNSSPVIMIEEPPLGGG